MVKLFLCDWQASCRQSVYFRMPIIYCKTHNHVPARWHCAHCSIDLCSGCVNVGASITPCPICDSPMQPLGMENAITPFWERLPKFFVYPARKGTLVYLLVLASLSAMVGASSFIAMAIQFLIGFLYVRYGYAVLESTAQGHLKAPRLDSDILAGNKALPFKQMGVFIIVATFAKLFDWLLGETAGGLVTLVISFLLPASVMALATRHSMTSAVNPIGLLDMVRAIGPRYAILWVMLWMLYRGSIAMESFLPNSGAFLAEAAVRFVDLYLFLVMFNLMGYVIYQYHQVLAYPVAVDFDHTNESTAAQIARESDPTLNRASLLIQQGHVTDARRFLRDKIARDSSNLAWRARYHQLLLHTDEAGDLIDHGRSYIALLMASEKSRQAAEVLRDCMRRDAAFRWNEVGQITDLAQQLRRLHEPRLAMRLLRNARHRFGQNVDLPRLYFLAAQILCEDLKQDRRAARVLRYLLSKYPGAGLTNQVQNYLALIERLKGA